jgi:hypothetical protein
MKQCCSFGVAVLAISLAVAPALHANITPVNYPTPMPVGATVSGVITNLDPVNRMIQVRESSGMVQTIYIDDHIQIRRNGAPVTFFSLSLGDLITLKATPNP